MLAPFLDRPKAAPVSPAPSTGSFRNPSGQAMSGGKPEPEFLKNILPVVSAFHSHT